MRLEIGSVTVRDLDFGPATRLDDHTLVVDREEIRDLVLEDHRFLDVDVRIVRPGDSVRVIHALDVLEPRWKVAGPGGVFPGLASPAGGGGEGRTHRLAGVTVVETGDPVPGEPTHFRERLVDMSGPGAPYSPFARTLNLVLQFRPNLDLFPPGPAEVKDVISGTPEAAEYNRGVAQAAAKVAARLGRAARDATPDEVEVSELPPCDPDLPGVVCLSQELTYVPFIHGLRGPLPMGTLLHPNECFDGAVVRWPGSYAGATYFEQNSEILRLLGRRHGQDLRMLGYIVFGGPTPYQEDKERLSSALAKLARLLGARAAVFLGVNGSNHAVDVMLAVQKCERAGVKTVLVYNDVGSGPDDPGFIFSVPEADAIVSAGSRNQSVTLPAVDEVLGGERLVAPDMDPRPEIIVPMRYLFGATDVQGHNRLTTRFD
jgi:glycine reductase